MCLIEKSLPFHLIDRILLLAVPLIGSQFDLARFTGRSLLDNLFRSAFIADSIGAMVWRLSVEN